MMGDLLRHHAIADVQIGLHARPLFHQRRLGDEDVDEQRDQESGQDGGDEFPQRSADDVNKLLVVDTLGEFDAQKLEPSEIVLQFHAKSPTSLICIL